MGEMINFEREGVRGQLLNKRALWRGKKSEREKWRCAEEARINLTKHRKNSTEYAIWDKIDKRMQEL